MIETYDDAIRYLEHLFATPIHSEPGVSAARTRLLLNHAGNPQNCFVTLHVTGSSGKGSTVALSAAILQAAGYRVGTFTSPHLHDYTERIAIDGKPIAPEDWTRLLNGLLPLVEEMAGDTLPDYTHGRPAFLEILWTMAAQYFSERTVDVAVVEVGMGGRHDPTVINNARVAVITNVSLEHTRRLGATTAEIAHHKAGVTKPGGSVVTAATDPAALDVIAAECARQRATLWRVTPQGESGAVRYGGDHTSFRVETPLRHSGDLRIGLLGRHQQANVACAVGAIDALVSLGLVDVDVAAVRQGVAAARIPGRLERVAEDPPVFLDGAHNPAAARALAVALGDLFPGQKPVLLLGILGDKDVAAMVEALAPHASAVVVAEPPWEKRSGRSAEVAALSRRYAPDVALIPDVPAALAWAQESARLRGVPLVVTGSLILVGAVRDLLLAAP